MSTINIRGFQSGSGASFSQFVSERLHTILDYDHESAKPNGLRFWDDAKNRMDITGTGLTYKYSGGEVFGMTSGTVTGFKALSDGLAVISAQHLSLSARALSAAIDSGRTAKFLDTILSGNDTIRATDHADVFWGAAGNDTLHGLRGADTISGGTGNDTLRGGGGNDTLKGDAGKDLLQGDIGADLLIGGGGADRFIFATIKDSTVGRAGRDTIDDFSRQQGDHIDLRGIDANIKAAGNQAFRFIGSEDFNERAGELRFERKAGDTIVSGDVNGDGKADFSILVDSNFAFRAGDFLL